MARIEIGQLRDFVYEVGTEVYVLYANMIKLGVIIDTNISLQENTYSVKYKVAINDNGAIKTYNYRSVYVDRDELINYITGK